MIGTTLPPSVIGAVMISSPGSGLRVPMATWMAAVPEVDAVAFTNFLDYELQHLATCNCARYRLPMGKTQEWIDNGRRR